jgi:hypothetical protein
MAHVAYSLLSGSLILVLSLSFILLRLYKSSTILNTANTPQQFAFSRDVDHVLLRIYLPWSVAS